jgi:diguanylate cyclase (GGDEF)-like protein
MRDLSQTARARRTRGRASPACRTPRVHPPTTPSAAAVPRLPRGLFICLAALAAAVPFYVLVPLPEAAHQAFYQVIATGALLVGLLGLKRHSPLRRRGWVLVLLGYAGWVGGDLMWSIEAHVLPDQYPAPSDSLYLSAYLVLGAGALVFVRTRRGGRDLAAVLDASIITTGAGVLAVVFLVAPLTQDSSLSLAGKIISSAYPLGDVFLLGVIARMYTAPGARTASFRLLTGSLILTFLADTAWNMAVAMTGDAISSDWIDAGWLSGYLLVGAAACVPSMTALAEPAPDRIETAASGRRLAALAGGLTLPGIALLIDGANGGTVLWPVIGIGSLLLSALVLIRMIGLLKVVQVQAVRLAALASSDALTGAPNRRSWDHELSRACLRSRDQQTTLSVAILDLDHFKAYNDTNGHQAGDRLLREAVAAWTDALPTGTLLARYGGEEFAVLFPDSNARTAATVLERLRALTPDRQTFSAGIAVWDPATDPATAIAAADEALYAAKRGGRDRVVVHGTAQLPPAERTLPLFTMNIQPILDLRTSVVTGHEALARFSGPNGAIDVQEMFSRAHLDGTGDLLELAAVRAGIALRGRPNDQELYVNVSARALTSERFLAGLPTRLTGIVFELCENTDGVDLSVVSAVVVRLRARGARIALDDVGAGAQEFARLAALRPDVIKIDRSLVSGCADDPGRTAVIRALVTYAADLDLTICAEGVEDVEDLQHLRTLGITHAQGYLLARPGTTWHHFLDAAPASSLFR